jgi:hypothetical protein
MILIFSLAADSNSHLMHSKRKLGKNSSNKTTSYSKTTGILKKHTVLRTLKRIVRVFRATSDAP